MTEIEELQAALKFSEWAKSTGRGQVVAQQWCSKALGRVALSMRQHLPTDPTPSTAPASDQTHVGEPG